MLRLISILILLTTIFSCDRAEKTTITWEYLTANTAAHLEQIIFDQDGIGHIVGGDTWILGVYGKSVDGGATWNFDSLTNKRLYDLSFDDQNNGYAAGIDGQVWFLPDGEDWQFFRTGIWQPHRGLAFWNPEMGITVSGHGFANGYIQRFDPGFKVVQLDSLVHELADIRFSDEQTIHIAGYGVVLRSDDQGKTWNQLDVEGDFFQEMQFLDANTGYMVGSTGSVLKTTDGGQNWNFVRKGNSWTLSDAPFKALFFLDEAIGYLAGDRGTLWLTKDGGDSWIEVNNLPEENFLDISIFENKGYLVGENGVLIRFDLL